MILISFARFFWCFFLPSIRILDNVSSLYVLVLKLLPILKGAVSTSWINCRLLLCFIFQNFADFEKKGVNFKDRNAQESSLIICF